jgi:hypothetical protein
VRAPTGPQHFEPAEEYQSLQTVGEERYPKGAVELDLYSSFYVQVPFGACDMEDVDHLSFQEMKAPYLLKAVYGDMPDETLQADEESVTAVEADEAISEVNSPDRDPGDRSRKQKVKHEIRHWKPEVYHAFGLQTRDMLLQQFPDGLRMNRVNGRIVEMAPEKLTEYWSVCKTGTGEQITSAPLCQQLIPIQDDTNNFFNMARETILRGIPKTFVDSSLVDREAMQKNPARIAELIVTKFGDQDINKLIGELPRARFPDQLMGFWNVIREMSREVGGIMPTVFGGGEGDTTWRAASQRKNQALMQLQPAFENMQDFVTDLSENGIRETARFGIGSLSVAGSDQFGLEETRVVDLEALQEEGWHVEAEESVPFSFGEKVDRISQIMAENPQLAQDLSLHHPMNVPTVQKFFGLEDLYNVGQHEREKALKRIRRLLQEVPIPTFSEGIEGGPAQTIETSSIPVDPFADKPHVFYAEIFRAWCNSPGGQQMEQEQPDGFRNVWLHGQEQEMAAQMEAMPLMGPEEEAAPQEAGGAPVAA